MKLIARLVTFFSLLIKNLVTKRYVLNTHLDYLNASDILYIYNTEDMQTGFIYMHINFASHHRLCIQFRTKEEYDAAVEQLIKN